MEKSFLIQLSKLCVILWSVKVLSVHGLNINPAKELDCINPHPPVARNVDYRWMHSVPRWYIPLQSKLNFYRYSESLLQKPLEELTDSDLSLNSTCITFKWGDPSPKLYGFDDKTVTYVTTGVYENSYGFKGTWVKDKRGRSYITLKDNKNYVFFTTCWEDGQASWAVISVQKDLNDSIRKEILEHAKSFGFIDDEFLIKQDYEKCPGIINESSMKSEL